MLKLISMVQDINKKSSETKEKIVAYLKENFSKKNNITRLIFGSIGIIICLVPSLVLNIMIRNGSQIGNPINNSGVAFGVELPTWALYLLRIFISLILLTAILFMKEWYFIILLSAAFTGGVFNLIDGMVPHLILPDGDVGVIDYIDNSWILKEGNKGNWPDYCIVLGIIGFGVCFLSVSIYQAVKNAKAKKITKDETPS